ncbi:unnamed protein product [Musa hybrid cultivar]
MDVCIIEPPGPAPQQKTAKAEDHRRRPLVPSEKNNAFPASGKPRTRDATSRYKSGISSTPASAPSKPRRSASPVTGRTSQAQETSLPKRAQSAERRRPSTPAKVSEPFSTSSRPSTPSSPSSRPTTPVRDTVTEARNGTRRLLSSRAPDGLWPSMRSLSSSFQSESTSVSASKREKVVLAGSTDQLTKTSANKETERKKTPLRGRNTIEQSENSRSLENLNAKIINQHRWPGILGGRVSANGLSRSVDLTNDKATRSASLPVSSRGASPKRMPTSDGSARGLQQSVSEVARQLAIDGSKRVELDVKSGVNSTSQASGRSSSVTRPSRTQSLPSPVSQRSASPNRALSTTSSNSRGISPFSQRPASPNRALLTPSSNSRGISQVPQRPSSPNRVLSTPSSNSRGMLSPSRTRPSTPISSSGSTMIRAGATSSALNYIADARKGKKIPNHVEDGHQLRLIYNAASQWHFVNAQAEEQLSIQKMRAEKILYSMWHTISKLRDSVIIKRIAMQHLRQESKMSTILNEQIAYLNHWVALEREHCSSLSGAAEVLKASTLRLPVTGGARADVLSMKNAVSSAVDVMQAMGSSICHLLSKVDGMMSLISELSFVVARERALLDECRELLATTAAMQVHESSLRTHLIQQRQDALNLE